MNTYEVRFKTRKKITSMKVVAEDEDEAIDIVEGQFTKRDKFQVVDVQNLGIKNSFDE